MIKALDMKDQRLIDRISPVWLGIGISGSLLVILIVIETMLGRWDQLLIGGELDVLANVSSGVLRDVRIAIVHCLVIGYLPAAFLYAVRSGRQTVLALQRALDCTREECETLATSVKLSVPGLVITGSIALLVAFAMPYMVPPVPEAPWNPSTWSPEVVWHRILGPATMVWAWWLGYAIVTVSLRLTRIARDLKQVDLFNLSPLAPFTQQGLTNALLLIGSISIWSLIMLETGFGQMMWVIAGTTLAGTVLALLSQVHGVHKRIRDSKGEELYWINKEISRQRSLFQNSDVDRRSGEMADLVAYRGLVEGVSEWPFTTSTYTRMILYAFLPVVMWILGFVAENVVESVFF